MQKTWILSLTLMFCVGPVLAQSELDYVGSIKEDQYDISISLGIEPYSDGKRWTNRFEKWNLNCQHPSFSGNSEGTYCHVERTRFLRLEDLDYETGIAQLLHSSFDGTLKLTNTDWGTGKLDFQLVHDDGSTIEVMLRLRYEDNNIHLKEFKAIGIVKRPSSNTMEVIEYRIPEYTYTLDMRVTMRGLKSESDKRKEELRQSLSQKDRAIWEQLENSPPPSRSPKWFTEGLREIIPEYDAIEAGEQELTSKVERMMSDFFLEEVKKIMGQQGFSEEGLQKIFDYLAETMGK